MHEPVIQRAVEWLAAGESIAMATVIETWGSSPRPCGSQLVVAANGRFEGSVSGGCIEGAVVTEALDVIGDGASRCLEFGVSDAQAWEVGLACGGRMKVHIRAVSRDDCLKPLLAGDAVALVTRLRDDRWCLVYTDRVQGEWGLDAQTLGDVRRLITEDRSALFETGDGPVFAHVVNPPLRMIVVGAVHIAQTLVPMAGLVGFRVVVIDPRRAFASDARLPRAEIRTGWPDEELRELGPDARTAVVVLTHDPKLDDPALDAALKSPAYYVGALGSRRTHARRLERLKTLGFSADALDRIHSPVGLDIGGRSPEEIALSILGEAVACRYSRRESNTIASAD